MALPLTSALPTLRAALEVTLGPLAEYQVAENVVEIAGRTRLPLATTAVERDSHTTGILRTDADSRAHIPTSN